MLTFGGSTHDAGSGAGKGVLSSNVQIANWSLAGADSGWATMALTASTADQELFYPEPTGQNTVSGAGALVRNPVHLSLVLRLGSVT